MNIFDLLIQGHSKAMGSSFEALEVFFESPQTEDHIILDINSGGSSFWKFQPAAM